MMWQHKSRMHWFSRDIAPLLIEVKVLEVGCIWRVKSRAGTFFQGKADHPIEAMKACEKHAREIAKRYTTPVEELSKSEIVKKFAEENGLEVQNLKISTVNPEDMVSFPDSPSDSNH